MTKKYFLLSVIIFPAIIALFPSCSKFDPPEVIPAYGHVSVIKLDTTNNSQGSPSNMGITDAWVYVDENPVGAFQMPCTFPIVVPTGYHNVLIFAGTEDDGLSAQRTKYPFYTAYSINTTLTQGSVVSFTPTVTYQTWTNFAWLEDFESPFTTLYDTIAYSSDTGLVVISKTSNPNVFDGNHSGAVYLVGANSKTHFRGYTSSFNLLNDGNPVYLEMNYKTDASFAVGLLYAGTSTYSGQTVPIVYVDTASTWKKMYVNISQTLVSTNSGAFKIYFDMLLPGGQPTAALYLDDLKLLTHK